MYSAFVDLYCINISFAKSSLNQVNDFKILFVVFVKKCLTLYFDWLTIVKNGSSNFKVSSEIVPRKV